MIHFAGLRDGWRTTDPHPDPGALTSGTSLGDLRPDSPAYLPQFWSIHWGGGGPYRVADWDDIETLAQRWWKFHTDRTHSSGGMSDVAYNYMAPPADGTTTD